MITLLFNEQVATELHNYGFKPHNNELNLDMLSMINLGIVLYEMCDKADFTQYKIINDHIDMTDISVCKGYLKNK